MKSYKILFLSAIAFLFFSNQSLAQKGFLRGQVIDGDLGDPLIGATIAKKGTSIGVVADFDGNYSLALQPGVHEIEFKFFSFKTVIVSDVTIKSGEVTKLDITLKPDVSELEEVVITAKVIKESENAILMVQKKSANVMDGMSSQAFRKIGDSNLSSAMKRVTGVSVQGGKYVYVRGLGDRYTRTTLNGLAIPGLDPERNDVQIDLFPTSVLQNIDIYKTFSPDLAGDFAGGTVNISTKSFPEEKKTSISFGLGYNPYMNLKSEYLTYEGGGLDFLGFDDGNRKMPYPRSEDFVIPKATSTEKKKKLEEYTKKLNTELGPDKGTSSLNSSFSFNHGNQLNLSEKLIFGYGVVLNYQNKYKYYEKAKFSDTERDQDGGKGLETTKLREGKLGQNTVLWSSLLTTAFKFGTNEIGLNFFNTQNGIKQASKRINVDSKHTNQTVYDNILGYTQRSILSPSIYGKHKFNNLRLEWKNSYTISRVYDPDFRYVGFGQQEDNTFSISNDGGSASRFWRDLNETNENFRVDAIYEISEKFKVKGGVAGLLKWRTFETYAFNHNIEGGLELNEDDPDLLLTGGNAYNAATDKGILVSGNYEPANNYEARSAVWATYLMGDFFLLPKLRTIVGARFEKATMNYTGRRNNVSKPNEDVHNDRRTLDTNNILPSLNFVYNLTEKSNLRLSYGRTLARPSFREKSIATIFDPIAGRIYNGRLDVNQTNIDNYDFRFENFPGAGQKYSIAVFYKLFDGHIETSRYSSESDNIAWRNIGQSMVYGVEFEARKNLNFLSGLSIGANVSLANSIVDIKQVFVDDDKKESEFENRKKSARKGEEIKEFRSMAGQAPYLINGYISFVEVTDALYSVNLSYNVQGESLNIVGVNVVPDVYTLPFHSLNLNSSIKLGESKKSSLGLKVKNILMNKKRNVWKNPTGEDKLFSFYEEGITFSVSYRYTF